METCKVTYVWTKDELQRALRTQSRSALRPKLLLLTRGFTFLLGALLIFLQVTSGLFGLFFVGLTLFCIYWTLFGGRGIAWLLLLGFDKSPYANKTSEWEISQQRVTEQCEDLLTSQFSWKIVGRIVAAREGFLLYTLPRSTLHWLPYDGFETPQCIEKVKEFARSNGVKVIEAQR